MREFNNILLVDDEKDILSALVRTLRSESYQVYTANSAEEALNVMQQQDIHVVVSDQRMPAMSGSELLSKISEQHPGTVNMMLSGYSDFDAAIDAINKGKIYKFISKPWDDINLKINIREAFELYKKQKDSKHYATVFEKAFEGILITDENHHVITANTAFSLITEYEKEEIRNTTFKLFDLPEVEDNLKTYKQWAGQLDIKTKSGKSLPVWMSINLMDLGDKRQEITYSFIDTSECSYIDAIKNEAVGHDILTGLNSRLTVIDHLKKLSESEKEYELLVADISNFSELNSIRGVDFCDKILINIANQFESLAVELNADVGRIGDDEFIIYREKASRDSTDELMVKTKLALEKTQNISGVPICLKFHMAYLGMPQDGKTVTDILQNLNTILLYAKEAKQRNIYKYTQVQDKIPYLHELSMQDFLEGIKYDEFVLYYQPVFDFNTQKIDSIEPLLRWAHPKHGILLPGAFLRMAQRLDLTKILDEWVFFNAALVVNVLSKQIKYPIRLSMNTFTTYFLTKEFTDNLVRIIDESDVQRELVEIELGDGILNAESRMVCEKIDELHQKGFTVAMNVNSETTLARIKTFDALKIDRFKLSPDMIKQLHNKSEQAKKIISHIEELALLEKTFMAVGVENNADFKMLQNLAIHKQQGFMIAHPMLDQELLGWCDQGYGQ